VWCVLHDVRCKLLYLLTSGLSVSERFKFWHFWYILKYDWSCDKRVCTVTRQHAGQQMSHNLIPIRGKTSSPSPRHPDWFWGPPSLLINGYQGLFTRGKAATAWSWPLSLSSAKIKKDWAYTWTPPECLYGIHRNKWTWKLIT
jgi:hypothetical protein